GAASAASFSLDDWKSSRLKPLPQEAAPYESGRRAPSSTGPPDPRPATSAPCVLPAARAVPAPPRPARHAERVAARPTPATARAACPRAAASAQAADRAAPARSLLALDPPPRTATA